MRSAPRCLILWLILLMIASCGFPAADDVSESSSEYLHQGKDKGAYWPTEGWRTASPKAMGMDPDRLAQAVEYAVDPKLKTDGLAIIRHGYIVAEAYLGDFGQDSTHISYSMAKSFSSALVGIAIDQGLIPDVDAKLCHYFDQWACDDDTRGKTSIRHVLTLTTGLKWHEDWERFDPDTNDAMQMIYSGDYLGYVLGKEAVHEPGSFFTYSTGDPMLLSGVITKVTGMSALEFAEENLFQPLGISLVRWDSDKKGYTATFSELYLTVRDYAKFGYLYLNEGKWEDKQVLSEEWVEASTRTDPSVSMPDAYGYLWHVNLPLRLNALGSNITADGYMARGLMGQSLIIIPSRDLVIVTVASAQDGGMDLVEFLTQVLDSIEDEE